MTQYNNFNKVSLNNLDTLHKVIRTVNLNHLTLQQSNFKCTNGVYYPLLNRGNIVRCEFIGIGSEIDDTHYAIVWDCPLSSESITVIPITSKFVEESKRTFCLGTINNFFTDKNNTVIKPSYVYLNKIKEVSRKRLTPWVIPNSNPTQLVTLSNTQIDRIKDAIAITYLDEEYIVGKLCSTGLQLPIAYDNDLLTSGYRRLLSISIDKSDNKQHKIKIDSTNSVFNLKCFYPQYDNSVKPLCNLIKYHKNHFTFRENILKSLFSNNPNKVNEAKQIIMHFYNKFKNNLTT
ncbi:PemK-like protein [Clostridium tepidiprofundi DSM 19306]|uniref:PemK-like protein n=1 Tax=Clostridium tepidiprofundi DSM 19306 TaxID=1121338 RepID=A0A151AXD8_9CLOT|nr:type II toxin-antitoxin system PemK/MazF family toxin [Clostridium tepidiprofundi]KYH32230.1 PemK-like protein [Clostridium tepidiprofundi DSM 19306]